jgi:N-acyl-D-amino-acid deacylase
MNVLEKKGISCNIASFVGTGTIRQYVVGEDDKAPTPQQLDSMKMLVDQAMEEGALGVTNALIYPTDFFAKTMS